MKTKTFFRFFLLGVMTLFTLGAWAQPDKDYLCFTAETEGATVELKKNKATAVVTIQYITNNDKDWTTVDDTDWTTVDFSSKTTTGEIRLEKVGDKVYFRNAGTNTTFSSSYSSSKYYQFALSGNVAASGNVMSLLNKDCITTDISADTYKYCFSYLFKDCTSLTAAPTLPATELASGCYYGMFSGCTNLTAAPALPATTLASSCYYYMFSKCESLATAPDLKVTTLAQSCYSGMFNGCTGLTAAPALPATTLAQSCYSEMFKGCIKLTEAPALLATTLEAECYSHMFDGCTGLTSAPTTLPAGQMKRQCYTAMFTGCINLTKAPALPATELAQNCYDSMFSGCEALKTAPTKLPATTLAQSCYNSMFNGCTGLTAAPELPATTLAQSCYSGMFNGCTGLTEAPALPAKELKKGCYSSMFNGCTNLTTVELPATSFETSSRPDREACYYQMFNGCEKLNSVKVAFTEWPNNHTGNWLNGVASTGTFVCPAELETKFGAGYIPEGWNVTYDITANQDPDNKKNYYATFYSSRTAYQLPKGVTAYTAEVDGSVLKLSPITDGIIPAGEGVVLKLTSTDDTEAKVHFLVEESTGGTWSGTNALTGTDVKYTATQYDYALSSGRNNGVGFYPFWEKTIGAHKAYLTLGGSAGAKAFIFQFDDATSIHNSQFIIHNSEIDVMYNLNGVRVNDGYKGIVIKNGKKYYNK